MRQLVRYLVVGLEDIEVHKREGGLVFIVRLDEVLAVEMVEKRGSLVVSVGLARETIFLRRTEGVRDWFVDIREGVERSKRARASSLPLLERGQERITLQELTRLYKEEETGEEGEEGVQKGRVWGEEVDSGNSSLQSTFTPVSSLFGETDENKENEEVGNLWGGRTRRGLYVNTVQISHV